MSMTIEQFGRGLVSASIMTPTELKEWWTAQGAEGRPKDGAHFAELLKAQGKLSDYQAKVLLQGKPNALLFDHYVFIDQLGKGGMGAVFKARHKTSGRLAAIKVMNAEANKDEKSVKRFQREVEAAGKLEHPNIVHAFDAGEFNGQHFLAMDYVDGADLASVVKDQGPLPIAKAITAVLQAAQGLRYAHEQGVIHRDIKPSNLLLEKNGAVRILDLGLVRFEGAASDGLTGTQQVMGTIDYMAPEQVANTKLADCRCDIYSLGVTLWILLTGKKLYESKNLVDRVMMHREAPIPSVKDHVADASALLDEVLHKMLAKKAEDRYQTMAEVCEALTAALKGGTGATSESKASVVAKSAPKKTAVDSTNAADETIATPSASELGVASPAAPAAVPKFGNEANRAANVGEVKLAVKGSKGTIPGVKTKGQRKKARLLMFFFMGIGLLVAALFGGLVYLFM